MAIQADELDLYAACRRGETEIVRALLDRGAEVDLQKPDGLTALMSACQDGHTEAAKLLLDHGAKVDLKKSDGSSPLVLACHYGYPETATLLLDRGAEVDLQNVGGWTALMSASDEGHIEVAKLLLDRGAKADLQKKDGWTALMLACGNGHAETAKLLLAHGAKVDMQDGEGKTALVRAAKRSKRGHVTTDEEFVSIINLLCAKSNRLSFADLGGPGALVRAREMRFLKSTELLEFLSGSSPLAPYELPLETLACFYAREVRTPQAAADLSGPELYFMGLKVTKQRHEAMDSFREAVRAEQPDEDTLKILALKVRDARAAQKRGQDAFVSILADLQRLLSLRPCELAASRDFDAAMGTLREAQQTFDDLQARTDQDEPHEACGKLACLMRATISGAFRYAIERLEKNYDLAAAENVCSRVWACLSDEPFEEQGDVDASDENTKRACQAAQAAIAKWEQREQLEEVILAQNEADAAMDKLRAAAETQGHERNTFLLTIKSPTDAQQLASELEVVRDAYKDMLRALRNDDRMVHMPLAEIRCALKLVARRHAEAREAELVRCRTAVRDVQNKLDELVDRVCEGPFKAAAEGTKALIERLYDLYACRHDLRTRTRHARAKRSRPGGDANAEELARLEDELKNLPHEYTLDCELHKERVRVLRWTERYFPELYLYWCEKMGFSGSEWMNLAKHEPWLTFVKMDSFPFVKSLGGKHGTMVHMVKEPNGRVLVLKAFLLSDDDTLRRFHRKFKALDDTKSPYLVHMEAFFFDGAFGCILLPHYEGGDLAAWIRDNPRESDETRKRIAVGVLSDVYDLHQRGLVHCDIKPENIFLTEALTPVLGTFDGQRSDATMTQSLQTIRYVAPELRTGDSSKVAPAVDLFSVGVVLGELFPKPLPALRSLIKKLQAEDPTQRPSARKVRAHFLE